MAYPSSLDSFTSHSAGQVVASADINAIQTAVASLETKVGVDSSAVTTSLDYKAANVPSPGTATEYGFTLAAGCGGLATRTVQSGAAISSGSVMVNYFRAPQSFASSTVKVAVGTTAAGSSTVGRIGLYSVNSATGGLTALLASTANDTALWTSANTVKTKTWSVGVSLVKDTWYALAWVYVGTGSPTPVTGASSNATLGPLTTASLPWLASFYTAQSDLPAAPSSPGGSNYYQFWSEVS